VTVNLALDSGEDLVPNTRFHEIHQKSAEIWIFPSQKRRKRRSFSGKLDSGPTFSTVFSTVVEIWGNKPKGTASGRASG
jgi:hypothetical protein